MSRFADWDGSILPPSRFSSPPYRGSFLPTATKITPLEEGDSRDSVERNFL